MLKVDSYNITNYCTVTIRKYLINAVLKSNRSIQKCISEVFTSPSYLKIQYVAIYSYIIIICVKVFYNISILSAFNYGNFFIIIIHDSNT